MDTPQWLSRKAEGRREGGKEGRQRLCVVRESSDN